MKRQHLTIVLLMWAGLAGVATAQPTPAEAELDACLAALGGGADSVPATHAFELALSETGEAVTEVELWEDGLERLACPGFLIERDPAGGGLRMTLAGEETPRRLNYAEVRRLRTVLSLDPFWVLWRVKKELPRFVYTVAETAGRVVYTLRERVRLADPGERLYGVYEEVLVVDPIAHAAVEYRLRAVDPDGIAIQDLKNVYEYPAWPAPELARVSRGRTAGTDAAAEYVVRFRPAGRAR